MYKRQELINALDPEKPVSYDKPDQVVSMFENDRWRKYSENFIMSYNEYIRGYFCSYYKRVWNESYPENQLKELLSLIHI